MNSQVGNRRVTNRMPRHARLTPFGRSIGALTTGLTLSIALTLPASAQTVDEAADACKEAVRLIGEDDIDGALDEARWCVESLQQVRQDLTLTMFPDEIDGFIGGELGNQSAMGMTMLERSYVRELDGGTDEAVKVSLTTGAAGAGLAALAQLGMSLGGNGRGKKLRVQKRTVVDASSEIGPSQYLVELKSGGMLTIESSTLDAEALLEFVREFPIATLDDALMR